MDNVFRNLGEYNKTIAAAITATLTVVSGLLGLTSALPASWSGVIMTVFGFATAVSVYMVRNQTAIDRFGDNAADFLDRRRK